MRKSLTVYHSVSSTTDHHNENGDTVMWIANRPEIQATILENIKRDRELSELPEALNWEYWGENVYSDTPTHVGEVEVRYNVAGHRVVYGFDVSGNVFCYMD